MDETKVTNRCSLRGSMCAVPGYSHSSRGEDFYVFPMEISRLSGTSDTINIVARSSLLDEVEVVASSKLKVIGEVRSFNNKSGEGPRLIISVFAREMWFENGEEENLVELSGTICKPPNLRVTPMGREICDLMLAVNRRYGRSDYLPCIAWGVRAREASGWSVGNTVDLTGRLQSRCYTKVIDGESFEKVAYEVSVTDIHKN